MQPTSNGEREGENLKSEKFSNNLKTSSEIKLNENSISSFAQAARKFNELKQKCAERFRIYAPRFFFLLQLLHRFRLELPEIEFYSVKFQ